ncbi:apolipoprotein N-acyltransferase [Celeribacter arenosi]|uniref:Apolipoprotein N-acyltransferase n=1 Tax=Celeribacter arenosi TaxID=792649 RepID=A0ABP7K6Y1_9RHOB
MEWRLRRLLAALGGVAVAFGQAPLSAWPVAFVGLTIGVVLWARSNSARDAGWTGWVFGLGAFVVSLTWLANPFLVEPWRHGWMIPFALFAMSGGLALFWGAAFYLAKRFDLGLAGLVALWGALELARGWVFTGFPWALPGYIWLDTPLAALSAWSGPYGLTLISFALAALAAAAVLRRNAPALLGFVVVAGALTTVGVILDQPAPAPTDHVVRVVQPNAKQHLKWDPAYTDMFFDTALALTPSRAADLVVWPETSIATPLDGAGRELVAVAQAAGKARAIVGLNRVDLWQGYNSAILLDATGAPEQIYDKRHLVPFGEYIPLPGLLETIGLQAFTARNGYGYSAGAAPVIFDTPIGRALPLICYEAIFPRDLRTESRPDYLLQITNDAWFGTYSGPQQSLAQARFRSIETGLPMVRAANTGISAIIDARGDVVASLPLGEAGAIEAALPQPLPETPYARRGEWPVIVSFIILLLIGGISRRVRTRSGY